MNNLVLYINLFFFAGLVYCFVRLYFTHKKSIADFQEYIHRNLPGIFEKRFGLPGYVSVVATYANLRRYKIGWQEFKIFVIARIEEDPNHREWKKHLPIQAKWIHVFARDCRIAYHKRLYGDKKTHLDA